MSLTTYQEAIKRIQERGRSQTLKSERVPLLDSVGRVLAESIFSFENLPAKDNSAMDGFVVQAELTRLASIEHPCVLKVFDTIAAGDNFSSEKIEDGGAYGIMTGAVIPDGAYDAVIRIEDVEIFRESGDTFIHIRAPLEKGKNIRPQGSDFKKDIEILKKGHRLGHEDIMPLAALGINTVLAFKKVKVGIISTGKEIVPFSTKNLEPAQVRNSSAPFLKSYFASLGCEVVFSEQNEDHPEKFGEKFKSLLADECDVLLTTGGVSMGNWDYVTDELQNLGVKLNFYKVAIRPGKPLLFGVHKETGAAVFGLPGNPVSTAIGASFFVQPYLRALHKEEAREGILLPLANSMKKPQGLRGFYKARIETENGVSGVRILDGQGSYMLHSLLEANSWAVLSEDFEFLENGNFVEVFPWEGRCL